ncbi:MAG: N-acetyltransferase family protein [Sedimentibacter sp.]|uniref:GNAT family N-acetyltransferase n=1 Tax=Sedimentibacter sp. TaxID=1960295 RepID=UPI0031598731
MNSFKIRLAHEDDYYSILEIYKPFITDTCITFEYKVPSAEEFCDRMAKIQRTFPLLVCEDDGRVAGYAYISRFREREAYDWSVESSIYIEPGHQGQNIGKALYIALIELAELLGYRNVYGVVTMPNVKSEKIHSSLGFETVGVLKNVGYKFDKWLDVKYLSLNVKEYTQIPEKPRKIEEVAHTKEFSMIMERVQSLLS